MSSFEHFSDDPEEVRFLIDQLHQIGFKDDIQVTCKCGEKFPIRLLFRCLYCGIWFCQTCAEDHFGKTREQWKAERDTSHHD